MSRKIINVASFFLNKDPNMTHKKLQKLVYYAYAWYIIENNDDCFNISNKLFDDEIEAWVHGPVCRNLYDLYPILRADISLISEKENTFLEKIWHIYGEFTGAELEDLTHKEEPWQKARKGLSFSERSNNVISDIDIYNYYSQKIS